MTTVSTIITDAFRLGDLIATNASPTTGESAEALRYLNRLVKSVFGAEAGEPLIAWPIGNADISSPSGYPWWDGTPGNDWFVPNNTRLMLNLSSAVPDIYLHPNPDNGSRFAVNDVAGNLATYPITVHGNGRLIDEGFTTVLNVNSFTGEWFYREDTANWQQYAPLSAVSTFPFPEEFDDFFVTMLAIRLNPSFGGTLDPQSQAVLQRTRTQLRARYNQTIPTPSEAALYRLSRMAADRDGWNNSYWLYDPTAMFNKGWPY